MKDIYGEIRGTHPELPPPGTKDAMIQALHDYENSHIEICELIPSEDQFYGWSKGTNRLAKYLQWVHVPAVKDAATEQLEAKNTALSKLLARTVRAKIDFADDVKNLLDATQKEYQKILEDKQDALDDISESLARRLSEWSHPDAGLRLSWRQDPDKSVRVDEPMAQVLAGEGDFWGEISRFGHGLQRSFLLALLQELSGSDDIEGPTLVLACEEPELYQHPPQARHLSNVLQKLSSANSQMIICTHSPYFVSGQVFEDVRMVRKDGRSSTVAHVTFEVAAKTYAEATGDGLEKRSGTLAKIHQVLQPSLNEMFFTPRLILVEGFEDVAYITAYLNLMGLWDEYRRHACHMVSTDCKSRMVRALVVAKCLRIPRYVIFDSDADKDDQNGSKAKHEKDNTALLKLCGVKGPEPFPGSTFWGENVTMWDSEIGVIVEKDIGLEAWEGYCQRADVLYGQAGALEKNMLHITSALAFAWADGAKSANLERLCIELLSFGGSG